MDAIGNMQEKIAKIFTEALEASYLERLKEQIDEGAAFVSSRFFDVRENCGDPFDFRLVDSRTNATLARFNFKDEILIHINEDGPSYKKEILTIISALKGFADELQSIYESESDEDQQRSRVE